MRVTNALQLERPGARLAAQGWGQSAGEPMLALHGWRDNSASFLPLSTYLSGYYLVALDFPGHGHSDHRPPGAGYLFVDFVADVAFAVQQLAWERFHLVGHSLGANVSLAYSAAFPERVKSLVLIDGVGPTSGPSDQTASRLRRSVQSQLTMQSSPSRGYPDWNTLIDARCRASPIDRPGAELLVRRNARELGGQIQVQSDRRLRTPSPFYFPEAMVMDLVRNVVAPTLVILAEGGRVRGLEETPRRMASFPNAQQIVLPGQHHLHMDTPEAVARAIRVFLAGTGAYDGR